MGKQQQQQLCDTQVRRNTYEFPIHRNRVEAFDVEADFISLVSSKLEEKNLDVSSSFLAALRFGRIDEPRRLWRSRPFESKDLVKLIVNALFCSRSNFHGSPSIFRRNKGYPPHNKPVLTLVRNNDRFETISLQVLPGLPILPSKRTMGTIFWTCSDQVALQKCSWLLQQWGMHACCFERNFVYPRTARQYTTTSETVIKGGVTVFMGTNQDYKGTFFVYDLANCDV